MDRLFGVALRWSVLGSWMGFVVDFAESFDRHVGVDLRRVELLVSQERLDRAQVRAAFEHQRRRRVAEHVATAGLRDARRSQVASDELAERDRMESVAARR